MSDHHQSRYLATTYQEIVERILLAYPDPTGDLRRLLETQTFIPAGNTLVASPDGRVAPNCCVLGTLTQENFEDRLSLARGLWSEATGCGFDLTGLEDPLEGLRRLSVENFAIDLGHRPRRGNMATLEATHAKIYDFIRVKDSGGLDNFNISVVFRGPPDPQVLEAIARSAWRTGDPGAIFLDTVLVTTPSDPDLEELVTCVPCGEQFLHAFETCTLGSINLASKALATPEGPIDPDKLATSVGLAVRFLDLTVDRIFPRDPRVAWATRKTRRIGLGVMGFADYLERLGVDYASARAIEISQDLAAVITAAADRASRGPTGRRNLTVTCVAPTGGITGLTGNRGYAIEPFFSQASKISPEVHLDIAAAWQSRMENAVSKTVNLASTATEEDIVDVILMARAKGLKGVTVYRDGCRSGQPMSLDPEGARCPDCS